MNGRSGQLKEIQQDKHDLKRSVVISVVGHFAKIAYPVLLVVVINLYGAKQFGIFTILESVMYVMLRVCILGLDKGILWWIPRQKKQSERNGLRAVIFWVCLSTVLFGMTVVLCGKPLLIAIGGAQASPLGLYLMTIGLFPMTLMELFVAASLGKRKIEAQVFIKETIMSTSLVGFGALFYLMGLEKNGLPLAFVTSQTTACLCAIWAFHRYFRGSAFDQQLTKLPPELIRYAKPFWYSEITTTFQQRIDVLLFSLLVPNPTLIGIYGAVIVVGKSIRSIRSTLESVIVALFSHIGKNQDRERLVSSFSYVTVIMIFTHLPIFAFLLLFADWIMPLFGEDFGKGTEAVLILCGFWILHGIVGLHDLILRGYGYSRLVLLNMIITTLLEVVLLIILIPAFGLSGASLAVGLAYLILNLLQLIQSRIIFGSWNYNQNVLWAILIMLVSAIGMSCVWFLLLQYSEATREISAFSAFMVICCSGGYFLWKKSRDCALQVTPPPLKSLF